MYNKIFETVLSLTLVSLCMGTEDNGDVHMLDDGSEFYRFGRSLLQHYGVEDESYPDQSWLSHPGEFFAPELDDGSLLRDRREFYRFGRSQLPFEEKRFLRFGRSVHPATADSKMRAPVQSIKPLYRKRRATDIGSQLAELSHRLKRSDQSNYLADDQRSNEANKIYQKSDVSAVNAKHDSEVINNNNVLGEDQETEKRFMRFGKRFMRFGRGNEDTDEYEKRFMRFGRDNEDDSDYEKRFMRFGKRLDGDQDVDKRFMRFGKRFMRFGRGNEDGEHDEKRFMRFGKNVNYNEEPEKRFMRFGKSVDNNEETQKRFMRFGKSMGYNEVPEKKFMRFGKSAEYNEYPEKRFMRFGKRFMRFGKRFMRFGRQGEANDSQLLDVHNDSEDVNAGHLAKISR